MSLLKQSQNITTLENVTPGTLVMLLSGATVDTSAVYLVLGRERMYGVLAGRDEEDDEDEEDDDEENTPPRKALPKGTVARPVVLVCVEISPDEDTEAYVGKLICCSRNENAVIVKRDKPGVYVYA